MNNAIFSLFHVAPDSPEWLDWKWQFRHRITRIDELARIVPLSDADKCDIEQCLGSFRMAITPYYASLMEPENPRCPIRMQAVPTIEETRSFPWQMQDPLCEESDSPAPNIVHRYPDRVLFLITRKCAMYCRHCTRRRIIGEEDYSLGKAQVQRALDYIARTPQIRDVLISGGDPLILGNEALENIVSRLRAIKHVEIIRIGTRIPAVLPMRITPDLLDMLKKYQPLWINTHFNHPAEIIAESIKACADIVDAGIPLGNQSVLLKGINDDTETMKALLLKLVKARVRPYYLYQCDLSAGIEHFRTKVDVGMQIIQDLTGNISGYAVPKFVIDAPHGGGKIPVNPEYVLKKDDANVVLRNYKGKVYTYPQPGDL